MHGSGSCCIFHNGELGMTGITQKKKGGCMWRLGLALLLWGFVLNVSAQVEVGGGSAMQLPDGTQLSFRISGPIQYQSFILNDPPRFVVDIDNARVAADGVNSLIHSRDIRGVRTGARQGGGLRIVVDLADFVRSKSTLVEKNGHHLVVDVFREERLAPDIARVRVVSRPVTMISRSEDPPPPPPAPPAMGTPRLTSHSTRSPAPVLVSQAQPPPAPAPVATVRPAVQRTVVSVPVPRPRPELPSSFQAPAPEQDPSLGKGMLALFNAREDTRPVPEKSEINIAGVAKPAAFIPPPVAPTPKPQKPQRERVVVIDPGHGGKDPGAVGPKGTLEKEVVLAIARQLRDLVNAEPGMRAVLTRDDDRFIRLYERIAIARRQKADLFISIHADAIANNPGAGGSSVYILSTSGASSARARYLARRENEAFVIGGDDLKGIDASLSEVVFDIFHDAVLADSMDLAEDVIAELSQVGRVHRRRVERAGFAVLKSPDVPSVLVETAFISNPSEEKNLRSNAFQRRVAEAVLRGIKAFFKNRPLRDDDRQFADAGGSQVHVIQPGESLTAIARRYRVPVSDLRSANGLHGDRVMAGSAITIPFTAGGS